MLQFQGEAPMFVITTAATTVTRKSITVLSWDDFESLILSGEVPVADAPIIDKMWDRAREGEAFILSSEEEDLINKVA
jgi:hypothetical protein